MSRSAQRPSKAFNTALTFGVSKEAPEAFHLKFSVIVGNEDRKKAICGNRPPGVFLADLKRNNIGLRKRFIYEDYRNKDGFTYDSLKLDERTDLIKKDSERIRCKTPFYKMWKKQGETSEKFYIGRGMCTVEANQVVNPRLLCGRIEALKGILKIRGNGRRTPEPQRESKDKIKFVSTEKKLNRTMYKPEDINSPKTSGKEIYYFEKKLELIPNCKRWCYNIT